MVPNPSLRSWLLVIVTALAGNTFPSGAVAQAAKAPPDAPADAPAAADASTYQAPNPMEVPPGTKADQALWQKAIDRSNDITIARAQAARLQWRAKLGNYDTRFAELAKGKPEAEAARLTALAAKVRAAWAENSDIVSSQWPVDPTRGCQYPAQQLESLMHMSDGTEKSAAMVPTRADVTRCIDSADLILRRLGRSTQEFEKALAEADAALAVAPEPATKK